MSGRARNTARSIMVLVCLSALSALPARAGDVLVKVMGREAPIESAKVAILDPASDGRELASAFTATDGSIRFRRERWWPRDIDVQVTKPGFQTYRQVKKGPSDQDEDFDLEVPLLPIDVRMRLVDAGGLPLKGVAAYLRSDGLIVSSSSTDQEGIIRFSAVQSLYGRPLELVVTDYEYSVVVVLQPQADDPSTLPLVFNIESQYQLAGMVTDASTGQPIRSAKVVVGLDDENEPFRIRTGDDGRFAFDFDAPNLHGVTITVSEVMYEAVDERLSKIHLPAYKEISLARRFFEISGIVVDSETGHSIPQAAVTLHGRRAEPYKAYSLEDGTWSASLPLNELNHGARLVVDAHGYHGTSRRGALLVAGLHQTTELTRKGATTPGDYHTAALYLSNGLGFADYSAKLRDSNYVIEFLTLEGEFDRRYAVGVSTQSLRFTSDNFDGTTWIHPIQIYGKYLSRARHAGERIGYVGVAGLEYVSFDYIYRQLTLKRDTTEREWNLVYGGGARVAASPRVSFEFLLTLTAEIARSSGGSNYLVGERLLLSVTCLWRLTRRAPF